MFDSLLSIRYDYCPLGHLVILLLVITLVSLLLTFAFWLRHPSSLINLVASPKVKTTKGKGVEARSMVHNTSRVEGHVGALRWGLGRLTSNSIIHMNLHKPNNKLITVVP